jgi:hypothetical protein
MNCTNCGSSLRPTAKLCIQCGTAVGSTKPPAEIKSEKIDSDLQRPELTQVTKAENNDTIDSTIHTPEKVEATVVEQPKVEAPQITSSNSKYEVSPEFANLIQKDERSSLKSEINADKQIGEKKSSIVLPVVFASVVFAAAGIYFVTNGTDKKQVATNNQPSQINTNQSSIEAPAKRVVTKELLNEILQATSNEKWQEVAILISDGSSPSDKVSAEDLVRSAQEKLKTGKLEEAQKAITEALIQDHKKGLSWLVASQIFAKLDAKPVAESALKLAVYLATNREQAISTLSDNDSFEDAKFKEVIASVLPSANAIPVK